MSSSKYLVWLDSEWTGLDPQQHLFLELATIVTDFDLKILAEGPNLIIHRSQSEIDLASDWVKEHSQDLLHQSISSSITDQQAQEQTLQFLSRYLQPPASPLCGNSVHMDRLFLRFHFPQLHQFFHYRNIDVSTIKELYRRWRPDSNDFTKSETHRALDDIKESIEELKFYRNQGFIG